MKPLTISDPESAVVVIQDEIRRSEEARYQHRLHAVLLVAQGFTCGQTAQMLGDAVRTVEYWVNRFEQQGFAGLRDGAHPGRPPRLNQEQENVIDQTLRKPPAEAGLSGQWDGKTLSLFIRRTWGISLETRQCQRLFKKLGFRLRKPRPQVASADPVRQEAFKKTERPGSRPHG